MDQKTDTYTLEFVPKSKTHDYRMESKIKGNYHKRWCQYKETQENIRQLGSSIERLKAAPISRGDYNGNYVPMIHSDIMDIGGVSVLMSNKMGKEVTKWCHLFSICKDRGNTSTGSHIVKSAFQHSETKKIALITTWDSSGPTHCHKKARYKTASVSNDSTWCYSNTKMYAVPLFWETLYEKFNNLSTTSPPITQLIPTESFLLLGQHLKQKNTTNLVFSLLEKLDLVEYHSLIIDEGYDKIEDLRNAPIDELVDIGLKKPHARRIQKELSK